MSVKIAGLMTMKIDIQDPTHHRIEVLTLSEKCATKHVFS